MKKRYLVAALTISSTLLAAIAQNTQPTMSGLLLGLRQDDPKTGRSSYRTLWIAPSNGNDIGAKLQAQAPGILVATDDGWWRVGVAREAIGGWHRRHFCASSIKAWFERLETRARSELLRGGIRWKF
jgi:hypothetical protein